MQIALGACPLEHGGAALGDLNQLVQGEAIEVTHSTFPVFLMGRSKVNDLPVHTCFRRGNMMDKRDRVGRM